VVKVTKIAVWKIGDQYFEDATKATAVVRQQVILELIQEDGAVLDCPENIARWVACTFDKIEARVKAAMAGA
jgi:hypothetical protein